MVSRAFRCTTFGSRLSAIELHAGAEHEVVDQELRAPVEQLRQRLGPLLGFEAVLVLDGHPGEVPPLLRELVIAPGELLLLRQQLVSLRLPFLLGSDCVLAHCVPPLVQVDVIAEYIVSTMANDAFKALAHPLRREIVERLTGGATTVGEAGRDLGVSKPTISRHLKMLEEAGVVTRVIDGRTHRLALRPETLAETSDWIENQRERWERLFDVVGEYLDERKERG